MSRQPEFISITEAAQIADRSKRTIQRLAQRNASTAHVKRQNGQTLISLKFLRKTYPKTRDTTATNGATTGDNGATHDAQTIDILTAQIADLKADKTRLIAQVATQDKHVEQLSQLLAMEKAERLQLVDDTRKRKPWWRIKRTG